MDPETSLWSIKALNIKRLTDGDRISKWGRFRKQDLKLRKRWNQE